MQDSRNMKVKEKSKKIYSAKKPKPDLRISMESVRPSINRSEERRVGKEC